jgi:hypothetical protein
MRWAALLVLAKGSAAETADGLLAPTAPRVAALDESRVDGEKNPAMAIAALACEHLLVGKDCTSFRFQVPANLQLQANKDADAGYLPHVNGEALCGLVNSALVMQDKDEQDQYSERKKEFCGIVLRRAGPSLAMLSKYERGTVSKTAEGKVVEL